MCLPLLLGDLPNMQSEGISLGRLEICWKDEYQRLEPLPAHAEVILAACGGQIPN